MIAFFITWSMTSRSRDIQSTADGHLMQSFRSLAESTGTPEQNLQGPLNASPHSHCLQGDRMLEETGKSYFGSTVRSQVYQVCHRLLRNFITDLNAG